MPRQSKAAIKREEEERARGDAERAAAITRAGLDEAITCLFDHIRRRYATQIAMVALGLPADLEKQIGIDMGVRQLQTAERTLRMQLGFAVIELEAAK